MQKQNVVKERKGATDPFAREVLPLGPRLANYVSSLEEHFYRHSDEYALLALPARCPATLYVSAPHYEVPAHRRGQECPQKLRICRTDGSLGLYLRTITINTTPARKGNTGFQICQKFRFRPKLHGLALFL